MKLKDDTYRIDAFNTFTIIKGNRSYAPGAKKHKCPLCGKDLVKDENSVWLNNNFVLFPSVIVHTKCMDYSSELGMLQTIRLLKQDWENAEASRKKYEHWYT